MVVVVFVRYRFTISALILSVEGIVLATLMTIVSRFN